MSKKKIVTTRRGFMKQAAGVTAAAAGFPYIIPSSALGKDGHVAPSNRVTLASIGTGGQGSYDTRALMSLPDTQYLAICDVDRNHRQNAKNMVDEYYKAKNDAFTGVDMYNDFREVLARDDIDAVVIATPDHWHAIPAIAAARAGKDICLQKPLTLTIAEGRALANAVHRYGRVFQAGCQQRSRSNFRFGCELVRNGRIGRLQRVKVGFGTDPATGCELPMAVPEGLDYQISSVGGYKSLFFSGEGLVCRFFGNGKVWIQTRQIPAFCWWVFPFRRQSKN